MNISKINAYNSASFSAKKVTHSYNGKHVKQKQNNKVAKAAGSVLVGTAAALAMLVPSCNSNKTVEIPTEPTAIYGEAFETEATQETEAITYQEPVQVNIINSVPMDQREKEKYHAVKAGDRLTDIVIKYAELDENYPYEKLIPYFNRLKVENPGLIDDKYNVIFIPGKSLRVDGIMPDNVIKGSTIITEEPIGETEPTVPEETSPIQITSDEDTVYVNGTEFAFDLGTLDKELFGDCEGLMFGKFTKLDKKIGGNVELTTYEGTTKDSNRAQTITYDKDGKIIETVEYNENKVAKTSTYTYKMDSTIETTKDNLATSGLIDTVTTTYSNGKDKIITREFSVGGTTSATFDFNNGTVEIGTTILTFDANTFSHNENAIGSKAYTGLIDGKVVRIDVLKNGFCIEYVKNSGDIQSRQQFDAKGNLIYTE